MVLWGYGVMVLWCSGGNGVMVLWGYGGNGVMVLGLWSYGVMVLWGYGVMGLCFTCKIFMSQHQVSAEI